jgi:hypothetical protein
MALLQGPPGYAKYMTLKAEKLAWSVIYFAHPGGCSTTVRDVVFAMQACGGLDALHRTSSGGECTTQESSARRTDSATFRRCEMQMRCFRRRRTRLMIVWSMLGIDISKGGM